MESDGERRKGSRRLCVHNEDRENPVTFTRQSVWGGYDLPVVDQCVYLGVNISKYFSWDLHTAKVIGKGKTHAGKIDLRS